MEEFWGRAGLLGRFEQEIAEVARSGRGRMLAVRGRRQVGKSRLLTHLLESGGRPHPVGTVKWRPRQPVTADELAQLTAARAAVPHAAAARLVAVCPAGSHRDAVADLTIDAEGIVAAYRGDHPGR